MASEVEVRSGIGLTRALAQALRLIADGRATQMMVAPGKGAALGDPSMVYAWKPTMVGDDPEEPRQWEFEYEREDGDEDELSSALVLLDAGHRIELRGRHGD